MKSRAANKNGKALTTEHARDLEQQAKSKDDISMKKKDADRIKSTVARTNSDNLDSLARKIDFIFRKLLGYAVHHT